jgi:hypothetical protein
LLADGPGFRRLGTAPVHTGVAPTQVAVGDLNGDGTADLVVADNGDNDVAIVLTR